MTETTILTICFLITFGFIGYKLFGFIKQTLIKYARTIEDNINESERLKMQAINIVEEAKKREIVIRDEAEKATQLVNQRMNKIVSDFDAKAEKTLQNLIENSAKKIDFEKNYILEQIKEDIKLKITQVVQEYVKEISDEDKKNATMQAVLKIDFKKLAKKK